MNWLKKIFVLPLARRLPACTEITRALSDGMDQSLSIKQRIQIRLHILICKVCARYEKQLALIRRIMKIEVEVPALTEAQKIKMQERLKPAIDAKSYES